MTGLIHAYLPCQILQNNHLDFGGRKIRAFRFRKAGATTYYCHNAARITCITRELGEQQERKKVDMMSARIHGIPTIFLSMTMIGGDIASGAGGGGRRPPCLLLFLLQ